jgi:8-oxo-dGTP pyrophosphatase MutT (NUDIX family)
MSPPAIPQRPTVRVLLLDPQDRLLLVRGRFTREQAGPGFWFTVGGGADPGETAAATALREVREETGFEDVEIGPEVWRHELLGWLPNGEKVLFRERYVVARCAGGEPCCEGWEPHEHELMDEMRWWTHAEIAASDDQIFPEGLARLLPDILAGRFPDAPITLPARSS